MEVCDIEHLAEKELKWMIEYRSTDQQFGYNLRMDSSTGMVTHDNTRKKISERVKSEYDSGVRSKEDLSRWATELWKDEEKKAQMKRSVSLARASYFIQRTKEGECVAVWTNINQIVEKNLGYKWQNIYAACNGSKQTYMKFKWERVDEVPEDLTHLIVGVSFQMTDRKGEPGFFDQEGSPNKADYVYLVSKNCSSFEVLGREVRKMFPSLASCFSRLKSDTVTHKGFLFTKIPFRVDIAKGLDYYRDQAEMLREEITQTLASHP